MTETASANLAASHASPPDAGSVLKQARLRRGQSVETVFQHTRIPKKFIEALEANRFEVFPASVYLHGFLKAYCDHLEVDFETLWNQIVPPKQQSPEPPATGHEDPAQPAPMTQADAGIQAKYLLGVLGVVLALGVYWMLGSKRADAPPPPSAPALPAPIAPIHSSEMKLKLVFRREAWVRLYADGRLRFEGRAPAGYSQEWKATEAFTLRANRPEDVDLFLDGKPHPLDPASKSPSGDHKITR
ncbi:MAG: helix-turn-helix domain-containing protein [Elusimicrobia bacterium]|nr:helix-turn-helix domain-containing protein [Elusimicrobiota bacterium]